MNKAIKMATGDYLLFINSGDELANNEVIEKVYQALLPETELASGILSLINNENTKQLYPTTEISLSYCINSGLTHPNTLIRKSLFDKYGLYNESNKIVSDWEFFLIVAGLNNCNYQPMDIQIAKFYQDGISTLNKELVSTEMQRVIIRLIPKTILKDLKKLEVLESLTSQPAHQMVQQSNLINKLLVFFYKIRKRFKAYKD
jgi:glycosyltransferase involved in cell wall biosynthesis